LQGALCDRFEIYPMRWIAAISIALVVIGFWALALWGSQHRHVAVYRFNSMPLPPQLRARESRLRWPLLVGSAYAPVQIPAPNDVRIEFGRTNSTATNLP
jgi:hypothetical protein